MSSSRDSASSSIWIAVDQVELPDKKYFKIGEVASLVGVEPHVLRYWQTQFPQVRPQKSRSGHRLYRRKDVETLLAVRELLHVQRFTIAGARQALRSLVRGERTTPPTAAEPEAPAAPRPAVVAQAVRVAPVTVEALETGALSEAMDAQLAARNGAAEAVEVGVETAAQALAHATPQAVETHGAASGGVSANGLGLSVGGPTVAQTGAGPAVQTTRAPTRPTDRRGQLGFGFTHPTRAGLEAARAEVIAMLGVLDRDEAASPQLRAPKV